MCSPLVSQSIDRGTRNRPRDIPEAVIVVRRKFIVVSDSILQGIEGDEGLRLWDLVFLAEVGGSVSLLHTAVELFWRQWLLDCHLRSKN
jgi:hypothetical protein